MDWNVERRGDNSKKQLLLLVYGEVKKVKMDVAMSLTVETSNFCIVPQAWTFHFCAFIRDSLQE